MSDGGPEQPAGPRAGGYGFAGSPTGGGDGSASPPTGRDGEVRRPPPFRRLPGDDTPPPRTAWLTATRARNALVLVRGKRTDQLPPAGPQLAQVAGAAGWEPSRYQEFLEYYLKVTRRARQVVDEVFWGEPTFEP